MKDVSITIAKGLGIIMMVVGHCGTPYVTSYFYMFHMPLFFILSGYCFKEKYLVDIKTFISQRVQGLYYPFVKFGLLFLLLHNVFFYLNIYNDQYGWGNNVSHLYSIREFLSRAVYGTLLFTSSEQLLGAYWFISQLFFASILGWGIIKSVPNVLVGSGIAFVLSIIMKYLDFQIPYTCIGGLTLMSTAFFVIGYAIHKQNIRIKKGFVGVLCAIAVYVGRCFWYSELPNCPVPKMLPYFITAVLGTLMTMQLSRWIFRSSFFHFKMFLTYAGNHTLEILTWHFLCFKLVSFVALYVEGKPIEMLAQFPGLHEPIYPIWWVFYSIVGVGLPLLGVWFKNRIIVTSKLK